MKNKVKNLYILIVAAFLITFSSCDSFLDVNSNPNKQTEPTMDVLLSNAIYRTSQMQYSTARYACMYSQQIASVRGSQTDQQYEVHLDNTWASLYSGVLSDLYDLIAIAKQKDAAHYLGVAEILMAGNLGSVTDFWGNVPYSEAFMGSANIYPKYDTQESIYNDIFSLLDDAIANLSKTETNFAFGTFDGGFDYIYGSDVNMWIKVAYAYKARFLNHLSKKGIYNTTDIINAVDKSFSNYTEDMDLTYDTKNFQPWYSNVTLANITGNVSITYSKYYIDLLTNRTYNVGMIDPRFYKVCDTTGTNGNWQGQPNGDDQGGSTLGFTENGWYCGINSPVQIIDYAELQFIKAEAAFRASDLTTAYTAYENGIKAHMAKLGVAQADIDAYWASPEVGVGQANLTLEYIMKEKFIAGFLSAESWNDIRRFDYGVGNNTYKNFTTPVNQNPDLNGEFIRRILYPLDENNRNAVSVNAAKGANYGLLKKVWWDE